MRRRGGLSLILCLCALAAGCQGVSVRKARRGPSVVATGHREHVLASGRPGLDGSDRDEQLVRAAASYRAGHGAERASKDLAGLYYLDALHDASALPDDPDGRAVYNAALAAFLRITGGRRLRLDEAWRAGMAARGIRITVRRDEAVWSPERFDEFLFPDDFEVRGLDHRYAAEGIGVPLIALRRFSLKEIEGREGEEKFLMPRQVYPVTALLRVIPPPAGRTGEPPEFRLELHDPLRVRRVAFGGRREPLAADLTTPLAYHFGRSPLPVLQEIGLLDPQRLEKLAGLYMLHPYEKGKIPVVLVHGLRSSAVAWMKVVNDLRGDPALRDRYQFWLFMYPTGSPFPASAATFRKSLDELREAVDPRGTDRALDQMVLIGHSMGGLISKMMIEESGDALWKLVGRRPFEELKATPEHRAMLQRVFFFEPHPSIRRVVFVATPHRGSDLGDQFIGRLADRLIRLPNPLRATYRALLAQNGADFFTPEIRAGLPSSIDELRRDSPLLVALADLPIKPGVVCHSIIGRKEALGPLESSGDGVVPYTSAHLDWAASERVVPGEHGCQDCPEAIEELRRILFLHLDQVARESGAPLDPDVRPLKSGTAGGWRVPRDRTDNGGPSATRKGSPTARWDWREE